MRRTLILILALAGGLAIDWLAVQLEAVQPAADAPPAAEFSVPDKIAAEATFEKLCSGGLKIVDLTWPLNARGAFWPGENYKPFELQTIATLERDGVLSKSFCMPEHQGTHIDAPNHFTADRPSVDAIPPQDLFAPGVVIDISAQAAQDPDYRLSPNDIEDWEKHYGPIPARAVVLLASGWGRHFMTPPRYRNADALGRMHFPGFSPEAVQWLLEKRKIRGIGIDTLSIDNGVSRDFAVHHLLGQAGRYGLENLAGLEKLPARDFWLVVAPIKIETGSGGPTRVFAILP